MTHRSAVSFLCITFMLPHVLGMTLHAQGPGSRPTVTVDDYGKWEQLGRATLSRNGQWMAYPITRVSEENELRIRRLRDDSLFVAPYGTSPAFSDDGRWLAYSIGVSQAERRQPIRRYL